MQALKVILPNEVSGVEGIIVELNAGVGGQEAMLFCSELMNMYLDYCNSQGWESNITHFERSDLEGARQAAIAIDHPGLLAVSWNA